VNPYTGYLASVIDPCDWSGYDGAIYARERYRCDGLGFVLNGDGIVAIDLDDCVWWDHDRPQIDKRAENIVRAVDSYTEFSPSRKGIHIWLLGCLPEISRRNETARIEIYTSRQYVTVTGDHVPGCADVLENRVKEVFALYRQFFPTSYRNLSPGCPVEPRSRVSPGYGYPPLDDEAVIKRARSAKNGARFRALFDVAGLCGYTSESEADQALCNLLAFWAAHDRDQMDRLFRRSARFRDKWNRQDYRDRTIGRALARVKDTWRPRR
jgi:primase-polymerase (primpol)-like protein